MDAKCRHFVTTRRLNALQLAGKSATMSGMPDAQTRIADRVRGIASEKRKTQEQVAEVLRLSRHSVNLRFQGKVPFTAPEILALADEFGVPVSRFFPDASELAAFGPGRAVAVAT